MWGVRFPGGSAVKILPAIQELQEMPVDSWVRKILLEKEMATHSSFLAWRIPWTEELAGLQSMGRKESDMTERLHFHFHYSGPWGFPGGSVVKNPLANAGDMGSTPGS